MQPPQSETIALGFTWYVVFLFSTVCHEGAHALAAQLGGDLTAFHGGQVTLNPLPHIRREPMGMVVVPILSYVLSGWTIGWASTPYDPLWQRRYPRRAAWMALAGPAANFALMLLAAIAIRIGVAAGYFHPPLAPGFTHITESTQAAGPAFAATFWSILFVLNLLLGTFNLLPVPPLDGHAVVMLFMGEAAALKYLDWTHRGGFGLLGLILAWALFGRIFRVIFVLALNVLYPGSNYV